jgi:predicted nuclease of restriction endonuclease-like (RecB) superfamily
MDGFTINEDLQKLLTEYIYNNHQWQPSVAWQLGALVASYDKIQLLFLAKLINKHTGKKNALKKLKTVIRIYLAFPQQEQISDRLSFSHYQQLCKVKSVKWRALYYRECLNEQWTCQELKRQIKTRFIERCNVDLSLLRSHYIFEFVAQNDTNTLPETELEKALINQLHRFILELGTGYAFIARQKRIVAESGKAFVVDLVFYNYLLKCFILFDLKLGGLAHQHISQIDLYRRFYDEHYRQEEDEPTIGVILCEAIDNSLLQYSILSDQPRLLAATYQLKI